MVVTAEYNCEKVGNIKMPHLHCHGRTALYKLAYRCVDDVVLELQTRVIRDARKLKFSCKCKSASGCGLHHTRCGYTLTGNTASYKIMPYSCHSAIEI